MSQELITKAIKNSILRIVPEVSICVFASAVLAISSDANIPRQTIIFIAQTPQSVPAPANDAESFLAKGLDTLNQPPNIKNE